MPSAYGGHPLLAMPVLTVSCPRFRQQPRLRRTEMAFTGRVGGQWERAGARSPNAIYQRFRPRSPPPPPPPPRLPPPKLDSRGLASFTLIFLPFSSLSLNCAMAFDASSAFDISTKPK